MNQDVRKISFIILIICLSIGGLISTDIFLPALHQMQLFYQVSASQIQNAIAIFLVAIAVSQLIYGPLSDMLGRKNILLLGLFIWLFATLGVFFTHHIYSFLILRLLQDLGACAGIVISRAIINDKIDQKTAAQFYLIIFPFVGMSPAIAPVIGGILSYYFGWQACFIFLTVFIASTFILCLFSLPETLPKEKRQKMIVQQVATSIFMVLKNKTFLYYAAVPCFAYAAYFSYLVESPFLLQTLGLEPVYIGYSYVFLSLSYVAGNLCAKKLLKQRDVKNVIYQGYVLFALGAVLFALQLCVSPFLLLTSISSVSILTFANGFLLPLGTASAIAAHSQGSGAASGVMGALQLSSASFAAFLIGKISFHVPHYTAIIISLIGVSGFVVYWSGHKFIAVYNAN